MFHDALNLGILGRQDQVSISTFYDANGQLVRAPVETSFLVDPRFLRVPRYRITERERGAQAAFRILRQGVLYRQGGENGFTFAPARAARARGRFRWAASINCATGGTIATMPWS